MGIYARVIFPRLCDFLLNRPLVAQHRRELLASAYGDVLEIGFGTGLNLPCYPEQVRKITAVDPNVGMHRLAQKRVRQPGLVGATPSLLDLDPKHDDSRVGIDFRRVYATVLEKWLGLPTKDALGREFERLPLFLA